jgi:hypothetical protein
MAEDTPLIILFILLGLTFLGGGAAAIIDGMPYLVLERGFTQVIIGTVVAVAGVILLALAAVLAKLRTLENKISGATMALSLAGAAGVTASEPGAVAQPSLADPAAMTGAAAVAGALAGAGLAAAATADTPAATMPEAADKTDEPDLFGAHLATVLDKEAETAPPSEPSAAEPAPSESDGEPQRDEAVPDLAEAEILPAFDPFRPVGLALPVDPAMSTEPLSTPADEPRPAPPEAAQDSAVFRSDTTVPEPDLSEPIPPLATDIDDPLTPVAPPSGTEDDEFGRLRDSLAGLGLGPVGGRVEPRFEEPRPLAEPDDLAVAASWMDSALGRRGPEPEAQGDIEVVPPPRRLEPTLPTEFTWPALDRDERAVPPWPPQSREAAVAETISETDPAWIAEAPVEPEAEPAASPAASPAEEAPAASDEGIVGAYQVGEAHFTIYADGSIKARTPEGDYSFASMDELKVYLASEKSRLGG